MVASLAVLEPVVGTASLDVYKPASGPTLYLDTSQP